MKNTSFIARAIYNVQKNVIKTTQFQHFVWSIPRKKLTLHRKKAANMNLRDLRLPRGFLLRCTMRHNHFFPSVSDDAERLLYACKENLIKSTFLYDFQGKGK